MVRTKHQQRNHQERRKLSKQATTQTKREQIRAHKFQKRFLFSKLFPFAKQYN